MNVLINWLNNLFDSNFDLLEKLLASFFAILLLWIAHKIVLKLINKRKADARVRYRWRKVW